MATDPAPRLPVQDPLAALSPRELQVLAMTATGMTNAETASRLDVSVHAIKFHLAGIYRKLGVSNRTEAAGVYYRHVNASRHEERS